VPRVRRPDRDWSSRAAPCTATWSSPRRVEWTSRTPRPTPPQGLISASPRLRIRPGPRRSGSGSQLADGLARGRLGSVPGEIRGEGGPQRLRFQQPRSATFRARSVRTQTRRKSPREIASPMSLAHVSRNAGIALGSSTSSALTTGRPTTFRGVMAAPAAPSVVEFGAPVVRSAPSGKKEGRVPSVSRVESRPSESGRQDSNLRPLGPERPIRQFHQSHRRARRRKRLILLHSAAGQERIRTPKSHRSGRRPLQNHCGTTAPSVHPAGDHCKPSASGLIPPKSPRNCR
jgi:hypothetical protein